MRDIVVTRWPGVQKVPSSIPSGTCFFFSLLFFPPLLRLVCFLVIVVLFNFFILLKFFQIYKFSSLLLYFPFNFLPFSRSPSRSPAIHIFLVIISWARNYSFIWVKFEHSTSKFTKLPRRS